MLWSDADEHREPRVVRVRYVCSSRPRSGREANFNGLCTALLGPLPARSEF